MPGLTRAMERMRNFDAREIAWQVEVIRENTNSAAAGFDTAQGDRQSAA